MKAQCYPQAGETIFNSGISAFDSGNYEEAKALLQKSFEMAPKETFSDNALFVLAQISEKEGDNAQAKEYYSRIVNEYSNSDVFSQSENKITELSAQNG